MEGRVIRALSCKVGCSSASRAGSQMITGFGKAQGLVRGLFQRVSSCI